MQNDSCKTCKSRMILKNLLKYNAQNCNCCGLCPTGENFVFGEGNINSRIMFVGEAPGQDEIVQKRPFIGKSGQLLTSIIENGMKMKREDVYITNVNKCRPFDENNKDRPPTKEEVTNCSWILDAEIDLVQPELIFAVGSTAKNFLTGSEEGITKIHGQEFKYKDILVIPIYHPAYVLRNGGDSSPLKVEVWEDIKKAMTILNIPIPN